MGSNHLSSHLYGILLVSAIALISNVCAIPAVKAIQPSFSTPHRALRDISHNSWNTLRTTTSPAEIEDTYESRALDLSGVKNLFNTGGQHMKNLAERAKLKFSPTSQQKTDNLFIKYKVSSVTMESNFLESEHFVKWANSVTKVYNKDPDSAYMAMAFKLISYYDDYSIARLLATASEGQTKTMAKRLEEGLYKNWIAQEKAADDVFALLKLDKEGVKVAESPVWNTWALYLKRVDEKTPDELMFKVLMKYYDDESLARILSTWKEDPKFFVHAGKFEKMQHAIWIDNKKNANDIFNILKLDMDGDELLKAPLLHTWVSYVKTLNKDPYEILLLKLAKTHDDESIASMLRTANAHWRTQSLAFKLAKVQSNNWQRNNYNVEDVFKLLKLQVENGDFLKSPLLNTWMSYATKLNEDPYQFMLSKLANRYGNVDFAKTLVAAKIHHKSAEIAEKLEKIQFQIWQKKHYTADDVFKLLRLDQDPDGILKNSALSFWVSYVNTLRKDPDKLLFSFLQQHYSDDGKLMNILLAAKNNYVAEGIAQRMMDLQLKNFLSKGTNAGEMFKLLRLNQEREKLFENPSIFTWAAYVAMLKTNPDETMFSVLKKYYDDAALTTMVEKAKATGSWTTSIATKLEQEIWISQGKTNEAIFQFLKLGKKEDDILETPEFVTWMEYVMKRNKMSKKPNEFVIVSELLQYFSHEKLARVIVRSLERTSGETLERIRTIQKQQFEVWLRQRMKADDVEKMVSGSMRAAKVVDDFIDYSKGWSPPKLVSHAGAGRV
ncbi:RxLR effector protein [Phytophthora megakarya]|uniref:RxLR effector protein n=1 Tax=Phytophthora megakarya TaxID=4795 RepID=A0A225WGW4_9STRA|nr:RxLR effector protein [Phytophthora megakarya]